MAQVIETSNMYDDSLFDILNDADEALSTHNFAEERSDTLNQQHQKQVPQKTEIHNHSHINNRQKTETQKDILEVAQEEKDAILFSIQLDDVLETVEENIIQNTDIYHEEISSSQTEVTEFKKKERKALDEFRNLVLYPLFADSRIQKIYIQRYDTIYIEKENKKEKTNIQFENENALKSELITLQNKKVEECYTTAFYKEFLLPGDIRIAYTEGAFSTSGVMATISLPDPSLTKGKDFVKQNIISKEMLYFLERCIRGNISILITSNEREAQIELLNLLNGLIPETESVIAIDSRCELKFSHNNVSKLNPNVIRNEDINVFYIAEQLKPDRISVNELTKEIILDFLSSSSSNSKSYTASMFANSPRNACNQRIPFLYKKNCNTSKNIEFLPSEINEALQIIVHITKNSKGQLKVTNISHADGLNAEGNVNLKEIFLYNKQKDEFEQPGYIPKKIIKIIKDQNIIFDDEIFTKKEK